MASLPAMHLRLRDSNLLRLPTVILAATLALGACSGGGDDDAGSGTTRGGDKGSPAGSIELRLGATKVAGTGADMGLDDAVARKVLSTVNSYLDAGVVQPLLSGNPSKKLDGYFGLRVLARVKSGGTDRAALTDESVPVATADLDTKAEPVRLDGLAGPDATILMVAAAIDVTVSTKTADGPLTIRRTGDLILEPADDGRWQISGYDIEVRRTQGATSETTSASTGPSSSEAP